MTVALLIATISQGQAANRPNACDQAAGIAAAETGVPLPLMRAIALAETGRTIDGQHQPWPWAINQGGDGRWFANRTTALDHAQAVLDSGTTNLDIGCFQLNHRWHGGAFASLEQMFDPLENARHAARFLVQLYRESGDWRIAAGSYHSRTPHLATAYLARLAALTVDTADRPAPPRPTSHYPLMVPGVAGTAGSLVPGGLGGAGLLRGPIARLIGG